MQHVTRNRLIRWEHSSNLPLASAPLRICGNPSRWRKRELWPSGLLLFSWKSSAMFWCFIFPSLSHLLISKWSSGHKCLLSLFSWQGRPFQRPLCPTLWEFKSLYREKITIYWNFQTLFLQIDLLKRNRVQAFKISLKVLWQFIGVRFFEKTLVCVERLCFIACVWIQEHLLTGSSLFYGQRKKGLNLINGILF